MQMGRYTILPNLLGLHHKSFLAVKADWCAYVLQVLGIAPPSEDQQANPSQLK